MSGIIIILVAICMYMIIKANNSVLEEIADLKEEFYFIEDNYIYEVERDEKRASK